MGEKSPITKMKKAYNFIFEVEDYCKEIFFENFELQHIEIDLNNNLPSRGGYFILNGKKELGIEINISKLSNKYDLYKVYENSSYQFDSTIGNFFTESSFDIIKNSIIHEISHCLQKYRNINNKGHSELFKYFYRILRAKFLPKSIDNLSQERLHFKYYNNIQLMDY